MTSPRDFRHRADLCARRCRLRARRGRLAHLDDGERYLDFGGGIAVASLGHAHPHLVAALVEQGSKLWHVSTCRNPEGERLAERLVEATFADLVFFTNSGAEANEARSRWRASASRPAAIPSATASSPSRAPSTAARWRPSRPAARRNISKASAPRSTASTRSRSTDLDGGRGGDRPGDRRDPDRADPGRGRRARRTAGVPARPARDLRPARPAADLRRGADRRRPHRAASSPMRVGVAPDIMTIAKGIGGGFPLGACLATAEPRAA